MKSILTLKKYFVLRLTLIVIICVTLLLATIALPQPAKALMSLNKISLATCTQYHTVRWGDNLYRIGLMYGVSWQWLYSINNLWTTIIYPGQFLCVATATPPPPPPIPTCLQYYTVQRGDTLSGIGQRYGISWVWLWWINQIPDPNWIYIGQYICIAK